MADFNRYITALTVIQRTCVQLGLAVPNDAAGNTDLTTSQLWGLLLQCGLDLIEDEYKWQHLQKTLTINTAPATTQYALPSDFAGFYNDTSWNTSSRLPVYGAITPQTWALLKARNLEATTFVLQYRISDDFLEIFTSPSSTQTLTIDYMSRGWVQDATSPTTFRDYPENDADIILFNPSLIVAKLKLKWREAKGFDTAAAKMDYDETYLRAKGSDSSAPKLSTAPNQGFPYLGYYNIPDTNYGL